MKKYGEKISTIFLLWSIVLMFLSCIALYYNYINFKQYSYISYVILGLSIPFIIMSGVKLKDIILILVMIVFLLISTFLSGDIKTCIFGFYNRYEGLLSILTYYSLFILACNVKCTKYKSIIIHTILILGLFNVLMAVLQTFKLIPFNHQYPKSFLGNSNSYSALCLMYSSISVGLFLFSKKKIYMLYLPIFLFGLVIGGSVGCYVGFGGLMIFIITYLFIHKTNYNIKGIFIRLGILAAVGIFSLAFMEIFTTKPILRDITDVLKDTSEILKGNISGEQGTYRMEIWQNIIPLVPKHILHGVGIDRLYFAKEGGLLLESEMAIIDKAHNEYLQILVTEGIFMLITYLIFLGWVIKTALKNARSNSLILCLLFAVIAYLIQALFGISVTRVTPILYIIMGLCINTTEAIDEKKKNT